MKPKYLREKETKKLTIPGWLFVAAMVVYNELMLHIWVTEVFQFGRVVSLLLFALGCGGVLAAITSLVPGEKAGKWTAVVVSVLVVVVWLTEYFLSDAYRVFMTPQTIAAGAGGVAQDYFGLVMSLLWRNLWRIGMMLLPIAAYAIFCQSPGGSWKVSAIVAAGAVVLCLLGVGSAKFLTNDFNCFSTAYNFDRAVRTFGLNVGLALDIVKGGDKGDSQELTIVEAPTLPPVEQTPSEEVPEETEPEIFYGYNELPLDFEALEEETKSQKLKNFYAYINSLPKGEKNRYSGMFEGKNLIFITAEAFAAEVIDPELTPTLYRLANEGIKFHEYYQPAWGASTTTGEFSNLIGLVPANGGASMKEVISQRMFLTIGNQLQALDYTSLAYHNHFHDFYERHQTHRWLGYDKFIARGTGLDVKGVWPESDLEMMEKTVDDYIGSQPFNIYYMTVSGHCLYTYDQNAQVRKHIDKVQHLNHSDTVKGYYASQLELEYALEYLVGRLEEAGIADDTVIVVATDHYPYGLERSSTWENTVDHLAELYGVEDYDKFMRDHNALIIWSGAFEDMDIEVTTPVYSLDILPTLSNLFGVSYDSRLLVGRDVLSEEQPLVLWPDYSWLTDLGRYDASTGVFTPNEGAVIPEGYQEYIDTLVANKITFSRSIQSENYYKYILDELNKLEEAE